MKEYLEELPEDVLGLIRLAGEVSSELGQNAYLIGGFVRDLILGVKNLDLDIAAEGDGIKFAEILASRLQAKLVTHKRFGTATIILKHHQKVDISTTRKEFYPKPASLPVVSPGSLEDDLKRRDFTINALAISITKNDFGKLIDVFKGKKDITGKKIRILHGLSFIDDPTRILRAIRFEKRYNFRIEPAALLKLKEAVKLEMLEKVEPQRLRDELVLILKEKCPLKQVKRMQQLTGFAFINSKLHINKNTGILFESINKQLEWFLKEHHHRRHLDVWLIYLIALLDHQDISVVRAICKRFVFRKGEEKRILGFFKLNKIFITKLKKKNLNPSELFWMFEPLSYEVLIYLKAKFNNQSVEKRLQWFFDIHDAARISVSGRDLKDMGLTPGPRYQQIFRCILNAKLDGLLKTKNDELEFAKKLAKVS